MAFALHEAFRSRIENPYNFRLLANLDLLVTAFSSDADPMPHVGNLERADAFETRQNSGIP